MNGHLTNAELSALKDGTLRIEAKIDVLDHIAECEICAMHFADLCATPIIAPPDLNASILSKIHSDPSRKSSGKPSIIFYSLRVCAAACIALAILFSGLFSKPDATLDIRPPDRDRMDKITDSMRNFTDKLIIHLEVDKK